jgi:hypothetical protein
VRRELILKKYIGSLSTFVKYIRTAGGILIFNTRLTNYWNYYKNERKECTRECLDSIIVQTTETKLTGIKRNPIHLRR